MGNTFTDRDMRDQVTAALGGVDIDYDVRAIVDELQRRYGTVPIDSIDTVAFWQIASAHDVSFNA